MNGPLSWKPKPPRLRHYPRGTQHKRGRYRIVADRGRPVPPDTRLFVWQRDAGRCRHCGAKEDLQFDHVIPRALGGSNSAENVELLCGSCNSRKGATLCVPTTVAELCTG
jgi:5-methylcytosine-specific restriction endonuclease McrA